MPPGGGPFRRGFACLTISVAFCGAARAQSSTAGAIGGTVVDDAGAGVAYARLTAVSAETGVARVMITDEAGSYRFASLPPGTYSLSAEKATFAPFSSKSVVVEVGRLTVISPHLAADGARETVVVNASAPRVDLAAPALSTNLDETALEQLPINERRWSNFALLTPAVVPDQSGYGLLSFRGMSPRMNSSTLDGLDNNQSFFAEERGRARIGYTSSDAAIREFQVSASNASAESGGAAGAVVNTVTRSGANQFHGRLFFYDRDNQWGAQNPFTQIAQQTSPGVFTAVNVTPRDWRKQWGAAAGGPLRRDTLFWFFTYDQSRRNDPAIARVGNVASFFDKPLTNTQLEDLRQRLGLPLPAMALAKYQQTLTALAGETGAVPRTASQLILFPKLDWQASERNHVTAQYNRFRGNMPNGVHTGPSTTWGVASFGDVTTAEDWLIGKWDHVFRSSLVNEFRYQYGRDSEAEFSAPPSAFEQPLSQNAYGRAPEIRLLSYSTGIRIGKPSTLDRPAYPDERRNQYVDLLLWAHGSHAVKAGYGYNHVNDQVDYIRNGNGTYVYDSLVGFVSDLLSPGHCAGSGQGVGFLPCYNYFKQSLGPSLFDLTTNDYSAFASDDWRLTPRLLLSYGVRYEYQQAPHTNRLLANAALPQTLDTPADRNNLAPRLGLAWDIFGGDHTVLRAGYSIAYSRVPNSILFSAVTNTGSPNGQLGYYFRPADQGAPPFPHIFSGQAVAPIPPDVLFFDKHFQDPQVHQAELSLGQRLPGGADLTASLLVSLGRELPNLVDTNIDTSSVGAITYTVKDPGKNGPLPATYATNFFTQRLNPNYGRITDIFSASNSRYEAAVVKATRRMRRSFFLQSSYTYAHAWDYNQDTSAYSDAGDILDPTNLREEYGPSNYDIRQRATLAAILETPWRLHGIAGALLDGYAAAPVAILQSGFPFSMRTAGAIPSTEFVDELNRTQRLYGLGASINGSGGAERIPALGRNSFRYPGEITTNLRLSKRTRLGERARLELMGEAFNVLNHQNVTHIDTVGYFIAGASSPSTNPTLTWNPTFGTVINANNTALSRERQIQLAARLMF